MEASKNKNVARDWYAIRTAPGAQRMAKPIEAKPDESETEAQRTARERRRGESILERNLRNEGIEVYMPAYWYEGIHHRTKKVIHRRLPLLVGYAFVNLENLSFEKVRAVDGVSCFLRSERGPIRFGGDDLAIIASEELRRRQEFRREAITRMEQEKSGQIMHLRGQLRKILPKGRGSRINLKDQANLAIKTMNSEAQSKIMGILAQLEAVEALDGLEHIDLVA